MPETVFTFWEGEMPAYIKLCMQTWKFPYVLLNYNNFHKYTSFDISGVKRFTLPQIADCVRVHVLRDQGGYWLDTDTIMFQDSLPISDFIGNIEVRSPTIGYLHTEAHSEVYQKWAEYQDSVIADPNSKTHWDIMGNAFIDKYAREHPELTFANTSEFHPEHAIPYHMSNQLKYKEFYFEKSYPFKSIPRTYMLMLHNSWTPSWYKELNEQEVLEYDCTLSNILRGLL